MVPLPVHQAVPAPSCLLPTSSFLALSLSKQAIVGLHQREVSVHSAMSGCGCVLLCQPDLAAPPCLELLHQITLLLVHLLTLILVMCIAGSVIMLRCMQALTSWQLRAGCRAAVRPHTTHLKAHGWESTHCQLVGCMLPVWCCAMCPASSCSQGRAGDASSILRHPKHCAKHGWSRDC